MSKTKGKNMKAKYLATAFAIVMSVTLTGCGSAPQASTPTVSSTPTADSSKLDSGACAVIANHLVDVQDKLSGLGKTSTAADAAGALKDASNEWAGQALIAKSPDAVAWLNNMSEQAAMLRVRLDSGDFSDTAIAIEKELIKYMNENSTFCN